MANIDVRIDRRILSLYSNVITMATIIEIKNELVPELVSFYTQKVKDAKAEIKKHEANIKEYYATITQLTKGGDDHESKPLKSTYSAEWRWQDKIRFALNELGMPSTTREIVDYIGLYEPHFINEESKKAIGSVSAILSMKSGDESEKKPFIKDTRANGENVYWNTPGVSEIFSDDDIKEDNILYGTNVKVTPDKTTDFPF